MPRFVSHLNIFLIAGLFSATLTSCMVGPNFHSPKSPKTNTYTESPEPKKTTHIAAAGKGGKTQYLLSGEDISAQWWTLFRSQELNDLIRKGIQHSPNMVAAQAALREAQENLYAQIGSTMLPAVSAQLGGQRERFSAATIGGGNRGIIFNLFNTSVNVSYTLDLFGGLRRQIEGFGAQVDYENYLLEATYLTLTSNIVTTAVTIASLQAQIKVTNELVQYQQSQLDILKKQFRLGGIAEPDVLSQETLLQQTKATLEPLKQSLAQNYHALAVLIGDLPSNGPLPHFNLDKLTLPTKLPLSVPSELVRHRPDIQASEALLHAASANIGVATANMYPQFTLTGAFGYQDTALSSMINVNNKVWNYGATILQQVFNGGSLLAKKRAAVDAYEQAFAQYKQTVLQGFQNVADTLRALEYDAKALQEQKQAEIAAKKALDITTKQYFLGGVSYLALLIAERQYQTAVLNRVRAQAARYADTAALFQALGGGWWNRTERIDGKC